MVTLCDISSRLSSCLKGMEIGVDFTQYATDEEQSAKYVSAIVGYAYDNGLLLMHSDSATIQLMPSLDTPIQLLKEGLDVLRSAVAFAYKSI